MCQDAVHLERIKSHEQVLRVQLYEAMEPSSNLYTLSDVVLVPARCVKVVDVELEQPQASPRLPVGDARQHFKISPTSVQHIIREEMPTQYDQWVVEAIMQYRVLYGTEQLLVKWVGYGDDRNTWEP